MTWTGLVTFGIIAAQVALLFHVPLFKPWFGFRKPKNHPGHWFE